MKRWMWLPFLRFHGIFKLSFFRHITILSGVGVGGGSLNYANTLPIPKKEYFESETWSHLADWENELKDFYPIALKMLGANKNPKLQVGDLALQKLAQSIGKEDEFEATQVGVYFGEPEKTVADPYFDGEGPERAGCNFWFRRTFFASIVNKPGHRSSGRSDIYSQFFYAWKSVPSCIRKWQHIGFSYRPGYL